VKIKELRYLRKSNINAYLSCPMQLLLSIKLPDMPPSDAMKRGTEFHNNANAFFDKVKLDKEYTYDEFRELMPDGQMYTNFIDHEWDRFNDNKELFMPALRETWMKSDNLMLKGTVDRVDKMKDGNYCVVEYKTGKIHNISTNRRELCIYMMILNDIKKLPSLVTHMECLWVDQKKYIFEKIKPVTIRATNKAIEKVRSGIDNDRFPKKHSMLCNWCPYIDICTSINERDIKDVLLGGD